MKIKTSRNTSSNKVTHVTLLFVTLFAAISVACSNCPPDDDICIANEEYAQFQKNQPKQTPVPHIDIGGEGDNNE